jgi:TonB-linked SusC/RagA family outer membrane protein
MRKFTIALALLLFIGLQGVLAQTRVITGTVTSTEDNSPIPGVTVVVKGTTIGTSTNVDGKYVLTVPTKYNTVVISYVGMKTKEITLTDASNYDVALEPDILNMEEVVVTAIGIPRETKALGYSVQDVSGKDLTQGSHTGVINSLVGKVSDVQVISSAGVAGASSYITIRGVQSITQNNQPLFVIDGVPISSGGGEYGVDGVATSDRAIDLNPDDIESINVLKGGAATALYGLRAASGAIIITTKKGKATTGKKISVTYNTYVTFDKVSQLPPLQNQYGQGVGGNWISGSSTSWGPKIDTCSYLPYDSTYKWRAYDVDGQIVSKNDPNATGVPTKAYNPYDFFQTGITYNNAIAVSGGTDVSTFYLSYSNNSSTGVVPNNKFDRNTFMVSAQTKLWEKVTVGVNANYIISVGDRIQQGSNTSGVMLGLLRTAPTFDNAAGYIIENGEPYGLPNGYQRNYRHGGGYDNPYWTANMNRYNDQVNRLIGSIYATYYATSWLTFTARVGVDWWGRKVQNELAVYSRTQPAGWTYETMELNKDFNSDIMATIDKDFAKDFNLKFTFGNNMSQLYFHGLNANANDVVIPEYYNLSNTTAISANEATSELRRAAFYGDLQLSWKNMVYLSLTGRNDWSTTLPAGNNSFFYPSVSGGFIFTQLPFLKDNKVLPYGKLRGSYAVVAKDASPYNTLTYYYQPVIADGWTTGLTFPLNGYVGYTYGANPVTGYDQLGNAELKPEKTISWEIGTDLKFYQNRIGLNYTFFHNEGKDLLLYVTIPASTGFTTVYENAASMKTSGNEITLDLVVIKNKDWEWDIACNFANLNNEVLSLAPGIENVFLGGFTDPQIRAVAGQPYRSIYGYDFLRNDNGQILIDNSGSPDPLAADYNSNYGYPLGMTNDMVPLGNVDPKWTMGLSTTLTWRDLSLYALLDIKDGGKMWNGTKGALVNFGTAGMTASRGDQMIFDGVLSSDGTTANNIIVNPGEDWYYYGLGSGFNGPASQYIEKSNWVRLRTVTLSYSFTKLLKKTVIKGLDVYFTGTNLWLSTPYDGIDPETNLLGASNAQGIDYFNMPGTKGYTVGLNLSF